MTKLILAERNTLTTSKLFIMPESRFAHEEEEAGKYQRMTAQIEKTFHQEFGSQPFPPLSEDQLKRLVTWRRIGEAPTLDAKMFDHTYQISSHPLPAYAHMPIIAIGTVISPTPTPHALADRTPIEPTEKSFYDFYLNEALKHLHGFEVLSGDLHLFHFTSTHERYPNEQEWGLYFTNHGVKPFVDETGLVKTPHGEPFDREVYSYGNTRLCYYHQDERRDVALPGTLEITTIGQLWAYRRAFSSIRDRDELPGVATLGYLYDKGCAEDKRCSIEGY